MALDETETLDLGDPMFHPMRKIAVAWNARTPEYLHHGTKANIIWQLKMTVVLVTGMFVYYEIRDRLERRHLNRSNKIHAVNI